MKLSENKKLKMKKKKLEKIIAKSENEIKILEKMIKNEESNKKRKERVNRGMKFYGLAEKSKFPFEYDDSLLVGFFLSFKELPNYKKQELKIKGSNYIFNLEKEKKEKKNAKF